MWEILQILRLTCKWWQNYFVRPLILYTSLIWQTRLTPQGAFVMSQGFWDAFSSLRHFLQVNFHFLCLNCVCVYVCMFLRVWLTCIWCEHGVAWRNCYMSVVTDSSELFQFRSRGTDPEFHVLYDALSLSWTRQIRVLLRPRRRRQSRWVVIHGTRWWYYDPFYIAQV